MKENIPKISDLGLVQASLRKKIKLYKKKAQEIEEYLLQKPGEWSRFQEDFNGEVNNVFCDIMDFEKDSLACGKPKRANKLKQIFIKRIRKLFLKGAYNEWSLNKPFGYAGDFKIIDDIYQNAPSTMGFVRLFDNYFQASAISVAVRNRKEDFKRIVIGFINKKGNVPVRVMDLACGPCRDIKEIISSDELLNENVTFDCYDHEKKALEFARVLLSGSHKINFIQENALRLSAARDITSRVKERYDVIFSTGLFDYLNYKISVRLVRNLRKLLKPEGVLIISDVRDKYTNPSMHYMEWVGEWVLLYRNDQEFKKVFLDAGFKDGQLSSQLERQGIMQYMIAKNKSGEE